MRIVPAAMTAAWQAEDKTGPRRPVVRATVQKTQLIKHLYDTARDAGGEYEWERHRTAPFTSLVLGQEQPVIELRNIKSCQWTRSVNSDVAECTLVLQNSELVPIGLADTSSTLDDFEQPGTFTYSRGEPRRDPSPWGYPAADRAWNGLVVPDRLVKTYEGYGLDPTVTPGRDPNLMQSGTWLIDEVTYQENGEVTIKMRDLGRLLLDQIAFPPCVPIEEYPLEWSKIRAEQVEGYDVTGGAWKKLDRSLGTASSSNDLYIGKGFTNAPLPHYVTDTGGVNRHRAEHVLDGDDENYWLSTGQDSFWSRVWWQMDFSGSPAMRAIRLKTKGGPYRVYLSVHNGQRWIGRQEIPYDVLRDTTDPGSVNIGAGIPFVFTIIADKNTPFEIKFKRSYGNVKKLRVTFIRLANTRIGEHPFNAGLRSVHIYTGATADQLKLTKGTFLKSVGDYRDYTDIVKWICAWGGFYWPAKYQGFNFIKLGANDNVFVPHETPDPVLPRGRVWGDFMATGTGGRTDLTVDLFDKKPLMDCINYVRDVVGFNFHIDEIGGVVWRMPNLWSLGNYLSPSSIEGRGSRLRDPAIITLNTEEHLLDYNTNLNSKNLRERVFVGNTTGRTGVVVKGYRPYPVHLRRVAGWTDQNFESRRECIVMADMVAARQMFDYRRGRARIAGYPAIQVDDQIRFYAPVTNETYYHYVESISSNLDMTTGQWTYDLESHWLGENPSDAWVVDVDLMPIATKNYLKTMGVLDGQVEPEPQEGVVGDSTPLTVVASGPIPIGPANDSDGGDVSRELLVAGTYRPGPDTTGVPDTVTLTDWNSPTVDRVTLADGAVIEDKTIYGDISMPSVHNTDIILRRCAIVGGNDIPTGNVGIVNCTKTRSGTGRLILEDCTIIPRRPANGRDGVRGYRYVARRCEIAKVIDGFGIFTTSAQGSQARVEITGNWVHNLLYVYPDKITTSHTDGTHNDCVQHQGGKDVLVRGNRFDCTTTWDDVIGTVPAYYRERINQGMASQGILVQDNTNTGIDSTCVYDRNWIYGATQQFMVKRDVPSIVYSNNQHYRKTYQYAGDSQTPKWNGYWMRIEDGAATTITGISSNIWVDGTYAGQVMTAPRDRGIDYISNPR